MESIKRSRQSMVNSSLPVSPRSRRSLRVRNGDNRHVSKLPVEWNQIRDVQPAVQRSDACDCIAPAQRKVQIINMKMYKVELRCALKHMLKHQDLVRQLVHAVFVESQGTPACGDEMCFRHRVPTREECHVVTLVD